MTELKNRIDQVVELLTGLAAGDLDARGERSTRDDDLDAVVVGINMLAEELGAQRAEMAERIIALKAAQQEALAASRVKSVFVANVSHEIRTPLATVLATAEILGDTSLDEPQLELVKKLQRSGERLLKLIEEILDFSRIEAGQHVLASTVFDLHALTAEVADVYVPRATREGIGFEWHLDPRVPRMVVGDPDRLFQVLTNLLDNAVSSPIKERSTSSSVLSKSTTRAMARSKSWSSSWRTPASGSQQRTRNRCSIPSTRPTARRLDATPAPASAWRSARS